MHTSSPNGSDIWLDNEVIQTLRSYKSSSEPDLNAVLRRLFELDRPIDERTVIERGSTSPREYRAAILEALVASGGSAEMTDIYDRVSYILRNILKPVDLAYDRWKTSIRSTTNSKSKNAMQTVRVIEYDDDYKVFRITPKGRKELEDNHSNSGSQTE